jgi:hypothetical protein
MTEPGNEDGANQGDTPPSGPPLLPEPDQPGWAAASPPPPPPPGQPVPPSWGAPPPGWGTPPPPPPPGPMPQPGPGAVPPPAPGVVPPPTPQGPPPPPGPGWNAPPPVGAPMMPAQYGAPGPKTNGLAIAGMVVGIAAIPLICLCGVGFFMGIVAIILSAIARRQIRESNGAAGGSGMALAGLICGIVATALGVIYIGLQVVAFLTS